MYNPFTDYINQIQKIQTVSNHPNRSNDQTVMLNTKTTTVPTPSKPPLAPLDIAETYSLNSTNNNPSRTNTLLNATANPCQTLHQPHTVPNIGSSAILPLSFSTVNPRYLYFVNTQNCTVPFVAMNKSVKTFDGLGHQYTPDKYLHRIDAHMIFYYVRTTSRSCSL